MADPIESESLDSIVRAVAAALDAQVSSFYQWQPVDNVLELAATFGLNTELVGSLRLRPDQGLTGLVAENRKPVSVKHPAKHPRYIHVPRSFEERLQSYLGVPVFRPVNEFVGVLTVQCESSRIFTPREISEVIRAAGRLSSAV